MPMDRAYAPSVLHVSVTLYCLSQWAVLEQGRHSCEWHILRPCLLLEGCQGASLLLHECCGMSCGLQTQSSSPRQAAACLVGGCIL